jgi:apolipoprotein N-acyltransferase
LVAVLACYIGGYFSMSSATPAENSLRVTAVQPSVPQTLIWDSAEDRRRFAELLEMSHHALTNQSEASDLLVWPESAVPDIDDPTYEAINEFVQSNHVWLILNGEDVDLNPSATNFYNAAFLVGPDGKWRQVYHKRDLVIFGEYVPLEKWLPFLKWLTPITGGWTPGNKPVTFQLERHTSGPHVLELQNSQLIPESDASAMIRCSPLICFEDAFPDSARDSAQDDTDFLVNLTNDGWFGESAEQWQHMADSVFRAVENGLPLIRCCNNGITCLIDGHGRLEDVFRDSKNSEYGPGAMTFQVPLQDTTQKQARTFYNRHGDWFGWGCVALTALMLVRNALLERRSK